MLRIQEEVVFLLNLSEELQHHLYDGLQLLPSGPCELIWSLLHQLLRVFEGSCHHQDNEVLIVAEISN